MSGKENTTKLRETAKTVIDELKNTVSGTLSIHYINSIIPNPNLRISAMSYLMTDLKFIDNPTQYEYRLTDKGWNFKSFEDLDNIEKLELEHRQTEFDLAKSNIEANKLNKSNSKWNLVFSIINIFMGALNATLIIWQLYKSGLLE